MQQPITDRSSNVYILLLLRSNHSRHNIAGGYEKRKDIKTRRSRSEEKVVGFSSTSLFPTRKREAVTQNGTRGIYHLMWRRTQGTGIIKGREDKRDHERIPETFT